MFFELPGDMPAGSATVHMRAASRDDLVSRPLSLEVTTEPLPAEIDAAIMRSVAPGQRTYVPIRPEWPLRWSERTQIEFRQRGRALVVDTIRPAGGDVLIPRRLGAGPVTVRGRTWRAGATSNWSDPQPYEVSARVQGAELHGITVGPLQQFVGLGMGSAGRAWFRASPGDDLLLLGDFPISDTTPVRAHVESEGRIRRLESKREGGYVRVRLPAGLEPGRWQLVLSARHMATTRVPADMLVVMW
jgi:hypothetical protein